jgi:pimeloyl-ACP methyl ester carboxylesterase
MASKARRATAIRLSGCGQQLMSLFSRASLARSFSIDRGQRGSKETRTRLARRLLVACLVSSCPLAYGAVPHECSALRGASISSRDIGLPTAGAVVRSARQTQSSGGPFCKVLGEIRSLDPAANPIRFEINLPESWNRKAVQFGGGAFNGYLRESDGLRVTVVGNRRKASPLEQGYTTFGSDSGHHHHYLLGPDVLNALNARFALNDEERRNFASDGLKKTHDVAVVLMTMRYGAKPSRMYFVGGSTGGREAMKVVDRWPEDYDGVMAAYAAWNQIESDLQFIRVSQAMYVKGPDGQSGWIPPSKTRLLRDAVLNACDGQDGLKDGIISNPAGCQFQAAVLRCKDGKNHKGCLSDGQERTVSAFVEPQVSDFPVHNGITSEPGYNTLKGADLVGNMGLFHHAFHPPIPLLNSFYYLVGDGVLRFFLTKDEHFNTLTFDTKTGGPQGRWVAGILHQSEEDDGSLADLTPFERHGGKLLLIHGTADSTIPTDASVFLYQRLIEAMGLTRVQSFARLYLIPGFGHGRGTFDAGFDTVGVLDAWADRGVAPNQLVVSDNNKNSNRERPMCPWPAWPKYQGSDSNLATSFRCETSGDQGSRIAP